MPIDLLGLGECMIDASSQGAVGGDVYNTLVAAKKLGLNTAFCTRVAMDEQGKQLLSHFKANGVDTIAVECLSAGKNGAYTSTLNSDGSHTFTYDRKGSVASQMTPNLITPEVLEKSAWVYTTGVTQALSKSSFQTTRYLAQAAKVAGKKLAFDLNYRPALWQQQGQAPERALTAFTAIRGLIDVFLPSRDDFLAFSGVKDLNDITELVLSFKIPLTIVKCNAQGVMLITDETVRFFEAVPAPHIKDTIGAGDAFNGGFLAAWIQGKPLEASIEQGLITAAFSLSGTGPLSGLPDRETVLAYQNRPA